MRHQWCQQDLSNHQNGFVIMIKYIDNAVDTSDDASIDEVYVTYADGENVDNHDYDNTC